MDSPAEPAVCTMLFSRMVASRPPANFGPEPEQRQRNHGDRNGRADGDPDLEHEVKRRGPENDAEQRPQNKGARRAFRHARLRRDVRMKGGAAPAAVRRLIIRCHGACNKPSPPNGEQNLWLEGQWCAYSTWRGAAKKNMVGLVITKQAEAHSLKAHGSEHRTILAAYDRGQAK